MRVFLFLSGLLAAAIAVSVLPAYGGLTLPPVLAWLPRITPPEATAFPAFTFWTFAIAGTVSATFALFDHLGVALTLFLATLWSGLTWFGFVSLPPSISFMASAVPWVGLVCFITLGITLRLQS